jgi:hypothetical protein
VGWEGGDSQVVLDSKFRRKKGSELYRKSDRRLSAKLVPTFTDSGRHVVSLTDPYGHIIGFLDPEKYIYTS